jgi:hypothetical protein
LEWFGEVNQRQQDNQDDLALPDRNTTVDGQQVDDMKGGW